MGYIKKKLKKTYFFIYIYIKSSFILTHPRTRWVFGQKTDNKTKAEFFLGVFCREYISRGLYPGRPGLEQTQKFIDQQLINKSLLTDSRTVSLPWVPSQLIHVTLVPSTQYYRPVGRTIVPNSLYIQQSKQHAAIISIASIVSLLRLMTGRRPVIHIVYIVYI